VKPVRFALLRSGDTWPLAELVGGLERAPDGGLELARLPGIEPPVARRGREPGFAGLSVSGCWLFISDSITPALIRLDLASGERIELPWSHLPVPGVLPPGGLGMGPFGWLFVAASSHVLVFDAGLRLRDAWRGFNGALAVAADTQRVFVLEAPNKIRVFDAQGRWQVGFVAAVPPNADLRGIALGPDGTLYASDNTTATILRLDQGGNNSGDPLAFTGQPGALTVGDGRLYVADSANSTVSVLALPGGQVLGQVAGYVGTAAGLALSPDLDLIIKPGPGPELVTAEESAARATTGELIAGPLDSGLDNHWYRVSMRTEPGLIGSAAMWTFTADTKAGQVIKWRPVVGDDELLERPIGPDDELLEQPPDEDDEALEQAHRFLWLRVRLYGDGLSSPRLRQVEAETPGESYIRHLPAVFSREEAAEDFLVPFLELARSQLGDLEFAVEQVPRMFEPAVAPPNALRWLAGWLGIAPSGRFDGDPEQFRALLTELPTLVRKRGTIAGLVRGVEIEVGARPAIFEDFRNRGVFVLDLSAGLGFNTVLPAVEPGGLVLDEATVGSSGPQEPAMWGAGLFEPYAHRFTLLMPPGTVVSEGERDRLRQLVDQEKPAHTLGHICFSEARMRIGVQARIGLDAIVAEGPPAAELDADFMLDANAQLAGDSDAGMGSLNDRNRVGINTRLG
jgi:phage tail-like protein